MVASTFMVIYWIVEYRKNEDSTVVEVKDIKTMEDAILPAITVFVVNPFIKEKLVEANAEVNASQYLKYLTGTIDGNEGYRNISYEDVTIDLFEYLDSYRISWKSSTPRNKAPSTTTCAATQKCPYVLFKNNLNAVFYGSYIFKGFGIELARSTARLVKNLKLTFRSSLKNLIGTFNSVNVMIHYPQQILHKTTLNAKPIWTNINETAGLISVVVKALEIQKKRNTQKHPCRDDWMHFDELVLKEHIEKVGCRAPYQKTQKEYPLCDTNLKMRESVFEVTEAGEDSLVPCEELSQYSFQLNKYNSSEDPTLDPSALYLKIQYPTSIKVITQSRLIGIHALIGYIGGYVGLFLGMKLIIQLYIYLRTNFSLLKNLIFMSVCCH